MTLLASAIAVFLLTHMLPGLRLMRRFCVKVLGERLYVVLYSLASIAVICWVGWAYGQAPYIEIFTYSPATHWIPALAMPVACLLLVAGLSSANPFSLGAGSKNFQTARPGIVGICRHPIFWGFLIWAISHMAVNGDVASWMVFGCMGLLSAAGPWLLDRKRQSALGHAHWHALTEQVKSTPNASSIAQIGLPRLLGAIALYGFLGLFHGPVIGVSPFAGLGF